MDAQAARRNNFGCATLWIGWALALLIMSLFVPDSQLRQTTGVITQRADRVWLGVGGLSVLKYVYTVDAKQYQGERYVHYYAPLDAFLRVNSPVLVWYDASNPAVSYAVNRPWRLALIFGALVPLIVGLVMILFALQQ